MVINHKIKVIPSHLDPALVCIMDPRYQENTDIFLITLNNYYSKN